MDLDNFRILVTRLPQHSGPLVSAIENLQGTAILQPLYTVEPTMNEIDFKDIAKEASTADIGIFISRNAIEQSMPYLSPSLSWMWVTVGESSAEALRDYGVQKIFYTKQRPENSELMLEEILKHTDHLQNKKVMQFTGEDGGTWFCEQLRSMGACLRVCEVYRRGTPKDIRIDPHVDIVLLTCVTSLVNLQSAAPGLDLPILAASERIAKAALEMGYSRVYTSKSMTNEDILTALIDIKDAS